MQNMLYSVLPFMVETHAENDQCEERFPKDVKESPHIGHRKAGWSDTQKCRKLVPFVGIN